MCLSPVSAPPAGPKPANEGKSRSGDGSERQDAKRVYSGLVGETQGAQLNALRVPKDGVARDQSWKREEVWSPPQNAGSRTIQANLRQEERRRKTGADMAKEEG